MNYKIKRIEFFFPKLELAVKGGLVVEVATVLQHVRIGK